MFINNNKKKKTQNYNNTYLRSLPFVREVFIRKTFLRHYVTNRSSKPSY